MVLAKMLNLVAARLLAQRAKLLTDPFKAAYASIKPGLCTHTPTINHQYLCTNRIQSLRHFGTEISQTWPSDLRYILEKENITTPTLIQEKTLPLLMKNKDLVGIARTGSGKTLAFAIPAVLKILESRKKQTQASHESEVDPDSQSNLRIKPKRHAKCLVLAPTRELADQINDVFRKFKMLDIHSISLVGGKSRNAQISDLRFNPFDVYVATPGRLMDLLQDGIVDLSHVDYLVLDEADRMLDMGFEPQIRKIISQIPEGRQTLMYSATWPPEIRELAQEFLRDYEYIAVDSEDLKANPNIKQIIKICRGHERLNVLMESLKSFKDEIENPRVLVFVNRKRTAEYLLLQLMRNKIRATTTHGDLSQKQRDDSLRLFKTKRCDLLIATDVASRGIDISDITHVVNYEFPTDMESYVHRIGRTARHDKKGSAISLFTEEDAGLARKLIKVLRETKQEIPLDLEKFAATPQSGKVHEYNSRRRRDFYNSGGSHFSNNREHSGNQRFANRNQRSNGYDRGSRRYQSYDENEDQYNSYESKPQNIKYRNLFAD